MSADYNLGLVLLSYAVAALAAFVTLDLATRVGEDGSGRRWLVGGALVMGLGIWSMHFIGMLALHLPVPLSYDVPITLASMLPAVLGAGLALHLLRRPRLSRRQHLLGALLLALGIVAMHYTGMEAIRMEPDFGYRWSLVLASVAIALLASYVALGIALRLRDLPARANRQHLRLAAAAVMGLAVVAMHYTGMAATQFVPGSVCITPSLGVAPEWLAVMVGLGALLMMLATLTASSLDLRRLQQRRAADAALLRHAHELAETRAADLRSREQHTRAIIESALDAIVTMDADGLIVEFNPAAERMFDLRREQVLGRPLGECIVPPELREAHRQGLARYLRDGQAHVLGKRIEISAWHQQGHAFPVELAITATPIGGRQAFTAHLRDLRARQAAEQSLRLRGLALDSVDCGICIVDHREPALPIEYLNPAFEQLSGYTAAELLGQPAGERLGAMGCWPPTETRRAHEEATRRRLPCRTRSGQALWCEVLCSSLRDAEGRVTHTVLVLNDSTAAVGHEQQLELMANFDPLTGLPNRSQLRQRLEQRIAQAARRGGFGVLFIDLDHFKHINDSLGHEVGDELLKVLAQRLKSCVREGDLVARLGGDEFVMLVEQAGAQDAAVDLVLQRLRARVGEPVELRERSLHITCSVGVSRFPVDGEDAETLLRKADAAMYQAKREGRNEARSFSGALEQSLQERLALEDGLRKALANEELELYFQPIRSLRDQALAGAEVLLRWRHPQRGLLAAGSFIAIAEETGLIVPIGDWVLRQACRTALHWRTPAGRPLPLAVNLSPRQLRDGGFAAGVARVLHETGFAPQRLGFELTESLLTEDNETVSRLIGELAQLGLRLAIDDFGTGYSNLRYLKRFPVSRLKIDRSFIARVGEDAGDTAITTAILALAHGLGLDVVGEGVETEAQQRWLLAAGCEFGQGYALGRPQDASSFAALLGSGATQVGG